MTLSTAKLIALKMCLQNVNKLSASVTQFRSQSNVSIYGISRTCLFYCVVVKIRGFAESCCPNSPLPV